jgi:hypothetical protein
MNSPSTVLAESIINRLVSEGLLTEEDGKKMKPKLAEGNLSADDWKLAVEKATTKGAKNE